MLERKLVFGSLLVGLSLPLLWPAAVHADEAEGLRIATERKSRNSGWEDTVASTTMVLRDARGKESERELRVYTLERAEEGDKSLTVFESPADVKGAAFLSFSNTLTPDDQWMYLPKVKRVKRIATQNKSGPFMSSEFAYEDMTSFELEKFKFDYTGDDEFDDQDVFVVEQTPVDKYSGYSKQIAYIDKEHYRLLKMDFFDKKGDLLKTLILDDYELYLDAYWRPHTSEMFNEQTGKSTAMYINDIEFKTGLKDSDLDKDSLKRAR